METLSKQSDEVITFLVNHLVQQALRDTRAFQFNHFYMSEIDIYHVSCSKRYLLSLEIVSSSIVSGIIFLFYPGSIFHDIAHEN